VIDPIVIRQESEKWLEALYSELEDQNQHSEAVVLLALRFGSLEDIAEARDILKRHHAAGHLTNELATRRRHLNCKLSAGPVTARWERKTSRTVREITEIKQLISYFRGQGVVPTRQALAHLFQGRAAEYLEMMNQLGQVQIDNSGRILI
jgi:hypothetical protein